MNTPLKSEHKLLEIQNAGQVLYLQGREDMKELAKEE